jgi:hypothetical protein
VPTCEIRVDAPVTVAVLLISVCQFIRADSKTAEIAAMHSWAEAKFAGRSEALPPESNLVLLFKPSAFARKNIPGSPFLITGPNFADGIAMRSQGEIQIQGLPKRAGFRLSSVSME